MSSSGMCRNCFGFSSEAQYEINSSAVRRVCSHTQQDNGSLSANQPTNDAKPLLCVCTWRREDTNTKTGLPGECVVMAA